MTDCVKSALKTNPKEVIIVDDGSTDDTREIAIELMFKDSRISLISEPNVGVSAARNKGIRVATGKYICSLDADDMLRHDFLKKTFNVNDIVGVGQQEIGDTSNYWEPQGNVGFNDFVQYNRINCSSLFLKEIWENIGGYDEEMKDGYEDWDFWCRATLAGYKVSTINEPLFYYRKHGPSMITETVKKHKEIYSYMLNKYEKMRKA